VQFIAILYAGYVTVSQKRPSISLLNVLLMMEFGAVPPLNCVPQLTLHMAVNASLSHDEKKKCESATILTWWMLYKEQNERVFSNKASSTWLNDRLQEGEIT
jgi:hypothetical protein